MEAARGEDVHRVGDVGLGIQEPEAGLAPHGNHGLVQRRLSGEHAVDAVARVRAKHAGEGTSAEVALDDENVLAARGEGAGELD